MVSNIDTFSRPYDKISVLVVPHVPPQENLRTRPIEIARHLQSTGKYRIRLLIWRWPGLSGGLLSKIKGGLASNIATATRKAHSGYYSSIETLTIPHILYPYPINGKYNQATLQRFMAESRFDCLISSNAGLFPVPGRRGKTVYIYDVLDDHITPGGHGGWRRTRPFVLDELKKADHAITISHSLQGVLGEEGFQDTTVVPNGTNVSEYHSVSQEKVNAVRSKYGLDNKFSVIYIGNHHSSYAGVPFIVSVFERLRRQVTNCKLLVVGPTPGTDVKEYANKSDFVVFTGPVPSDNIAAFFAATSVGVLPFAHGPFTDHALPLKVIEYGAARKIVFASPLKELETIRLPHVRLLPLNEDEWVAALKQEAMNPSPWEPTWDDTILEYDWSKTLLQLDSIVERYVKKATMTDKNCVVI